MVNFIFLWMWLVGCFLSLAIVGFVNEPGERVSGLQTVLVALWPFFPFFYAAFYLQDKWNSDNH